MNARVNSQGSMSASTKAQTNANVNSAVRANTGANTNANANVNTNATNSQGLQHASPTGIAHASPNSVLARGSVQATALPGLTTGLTVNDSTGASIGTVNQIVTGTDGSIRAVIVTKTDGGTIRLAPTTLSISGGVVTTTNSGRLTTFSRAQYGRASARGSGLLHSQVFVHGVKPARRAR